MMKYVYLALLVLLGLLLGVGSTLAVLWPASNRLIERAAAVRAAAAVAKHPEKPWDFWTIEIENLANDLKDERAKLKKRDEELSQREARLVVEQQELEKTRKQIEALRVTIDERLIEVTESELPNLKKLAATYTALTPKACVAIFREMEDPTLVKLFTLMKPETVGPILEEMSKQSTATADPTLAKRAAMLSERLRLVKAAPKPP
jgi:flagellar motility protein MotE (MotC chaperone)